MEFLCVKLPEKIENFENFPGLDFERREKSKFF